MLHDPHFSCFRFLAASCLLFATGCGGVGSRTQEGPADSGGDDAGKSPPSSCDPATAAPLSINYDKDTELPAGCYLAKNIVRVELGATLTLDPGVTIFFAERTRLEIDAESALHAAATNERPILLTGTKRVRGHWDGVQFRSDSPKNDLEHVVVEYGGTSSGAAISLAAGARATVSQSTLRESAGNGLHLDDGARLPSFGGNTITANSETASVCVDCVDQLTTGNAYAGNDVDAIALGGALSVAHDTTWPNLVIPYLAPGRTFIDSHLTLSPGVAIRFPQDSAFEVSRTGALTAKGTAIAPIVLVGTKDVAGWWGGVVVGSSSSPDNLFEWVTVADAGNGSHSYYKADVSLEFMGGAPVRFSARNCTFRTSSGWGVAVGSTRALNADIESANTFTDVALGHIEWN